MRYTETIEICNVCGKLFYGEPINVHGSRDYIRHTNFSFNIPVMLSRTEKIQRNKRADAIVEKFFEDGNKALSKKDAIEFFECFKHYKKCSDKELLDEVFGKIQNRIDRME